MPKTATKTLSIEKLAAVVKPFVGSLKGKHFSRLVLKTALINETHIIATDSHRLIRIKHHQEIIYPCLHHFKKELTQDCSVSSYPNTDRLLPDKYHAKQEININVAEWLEAHELGLIAAKEHENNAIYFEKNSFLVNAVKSFINKKGKEEKTPIHDQIAFKYFLDTNTGIQEPVAYNCEYMLDGLKALKKLGKTQATLYFYGNMRPLYFVADDVEILILPVRTF